MKNLTIKKEKFDRLYRQMLDELVGDVRAELSIQDIVEIKLDNYERAFRTISIFPKIEYQIGSFHIIPLEYIRLDERFTNMYPIMDELEFKSLKESIILNGQIEPVLFWRGKVVDGRHRFLALKELEINFIKGVEMDYNKTFDEVKEYVDGYNNTRRHLSKSQKAIKAYYEWKKNGGSKDKYAKKYGVNSSFLTYCEVVENNSKVKKKEEPLPVILGKYYLDELFNKGKVELPNGVIARSLTALNDYVKKQEKILRAKPKEVTNSLFDGIDKSMFDDETINEAENAYKILKKFTNNGETTVLSLIKKRLPELIKKSVDKGE